MIARGESMDKLYEAIPKKYLPERMGGDMKEVDQSIWRKDLAKKAKQVHLIYYTYDITQFYEKCLYNVC